MTLTRRIPLRRRSAKLVAAMRVYNQRREAFLAEHPTCEHPTNHLNGSVRSEVVHHQRGRFGRRLLDERWWKASCSPCNAEAEDDTGKSRACGWLISIESVDTYAAEEAARGNGAA